MKATYRTTLTGMVAGLVFGIFTTSCSFDEQVKSVSSRTNDFEINIHTTHVGQTRSTVITDGTQLATLTAAESKASNLVFGIFQSATGNAKVDAQEVDCTTSGAATAISTGLTKEPSKTFSGTDTQPTDGDYVLAVVNVPAAVASGLTGATGDAGTTPMQAFKNVELDIDNALAFGSTTTTNPEELPMMGISTITYKSVSDKWVSDITVRHLVSKVTLGTLKVDFDGSNHTAATFTPTEVFLYNVPEKINFDFDEDGVYQFSQGTISNYYQGETTNTTNQKEYLGTGVNDPSDSNTFIAKTLKASDATFGTTYTLYTLPNNDSSNPTKLIIKGRYSSDGTTWNERDAYYPITLATAGADEVLANKHYVLNVTIKGDGATVVTNDYPDNIQDLEVETTVLDFDDIPYSATYGSSGIVSYSNMYESISVGDLIYQDGTWSTAADRTSAEFASKTPVAIVFATTSDPTNPITMPAYDISLGFTHGYAIALKESSPSATQWSTATQTTTLTSQVYPSSGSPSQSNYMEVVNDLDGLKHCAEIQSKIDDGSKALASLPAYKSAIEYKAVAGETLAEHTSGWYLPSIGQIYLMEKNMDSSYLNLLKIENNYIEFDNLPSSTLTMFNTFLTSRGLTSGTHFTAVVNNMGYWTSSERAANYPYIFESHCGYGHALNGNEPSTTKSRGNTYPLKVRPVIAF